MSSDPWFDAPTRTERVMSYMDLNAGYFKDAGQFIHDVNIVCEALAAVALASTHYPSMPAGFTGDWKVLRDIAASACDLEEDRA